MHVYMYYKFCYYFNMMKTIKLWGIQTLKSMLNHTKFANLITVIDNISLHVYIVLSTIKK